VSLHRVRRRSRRTYSTHFEIFRRRVDGVVIYFFNSDCKFFDHASRVSWGLWLNPDTPPDSWWTLPATNYQEGYQGPPCQLADSQLYLGPLSYCSTVVLPSNPNPNPNFSGKEGRGEGNIGSSRPWASHLPDRSRFQRVLKCH